MKNFLKKQWFFLGIVLMIVIAFNFPSIGTFIKKYKILKVGIFLAFFITGLKLETSNILQQLKNLKVLLVALISSLLLFPGITYFLAKIVFKSSPDFVIGALIISVAPVTVASGTVMTSIALGNVPLSLFICVLSNFISILTIPFLLNLFLQFGQNIELPVFKMLQSLIIVVLVPTILGQILRPKLKKIIEPYRKGFSVFSQCIVLMIIFNAVSSSASKISDVGFGIAWIFLFMIFIHTLFLSLNYGLSKILRLDLPSTAAFTIHTSQKTLTVSYLVWSGYFAQSFPLGLIPAISYHLTQMIMDTIVAHNFRKKMR